MADARCGRAALRQVLPAFSSAHARLACATPRPPSACFAAAWRAAARAGDIARRWHHSSFFRTSSVKLQHTIHPPARRTYIVKHMYTLPSHTTFLAQLNTINLYSLRREQTACSGCSVTPENSPRCMICAILVHFQQRLLVWGIFNLSSQEKTGAYIERSIKRSSLCSTQLWSSKYSAE